MTKALSGLFMLMGVFITLIGIVGMFTSPEDGGIVVGIFVSTFGAFLLFCGYKLGKLPRTSKPEVARTATVTVQSREPEYQPAPRTVTPTRIWSPNRIRIEAVGETFRQDAYRNIFDGRPAFNSENGAEIYGELILIPDPANPHDHKAVAVWYQDNHIGYMSREEAANYHDKIAALDPSGALAVDGRIWSRNVQGSVRSRVYFYLPDLDAPPLAGEPPSTETEITIPVGSTIQVIGEEHHMDTLAPLVVDGVERGLWVRLKTSIDFRPKSARERVDVFLGDARIGWLSDVQTSNMIALVKLAENQGKTAVARASVSGSILKANAVLYVAKASEVSSEWIRENSGRGATPPKRPEFMWDDED